MRFADQRFTLAKAVSILGLGFLGFQSTAGQAHGEAEPVTIENPVKPRLLPEELVHAFNVQIKNELEGAHEYLAMAHHCYLLRLDGFGFWFTQQYYEELNHARILMDFLKRKNALLAIPASEAPTPIPPTADPLTLFNNSLKLEQTQTARLNYLYGLAQKVNAYEASIFLQWFLSEQVQEEDAFQTVLNRIVIVENSPDGILQIDAELAARAPAVIWMPGQPLP